MACKLVKVQKLAMLGFIGMPAGASIQGN